MDLKPGFPCIASALRDGRHMMWTTKSVVEGFALEFFAGLLGLHHGLCITYPAESAVRVDSQCLQIRR